MRQEGGPMYGITDIFYNPIASSISEIFSIQVELKRVDDICHNFLIDALVVKDADKVWKNTQS